MLTKEGLIAAAKASSGAKHDTVQLHFDAIEIEIVANNKLRIWLTDGGVRMLYTDVKAMPGDFEVDDVVHFRGIEGHSWVNIDQP